MNMNIKINTEHPRKVHLSIFFSVSYDSDFSALSISEVTLNRLDFCDAKYFFSNQAMHSLRNNRKEVPLSS